LFSKYNLSPNCVRDGSREREPLVDIWSVRIDNEYRAIGRWRNEEWRMVRGSAGSLTGLDVFRRAGDHRGLPREGEGNELRHQEFRKNQKPF
jgi:hypothetical protein